MLKFNKTMDKHAMDIIRDHVLIGSLKWHVGRDLRVVLYLPHDYLTFTDMKECIAIAKWKQLGQ